MSIRMFLLGVKVVMRVVRVVQLAVSLQTSIIHLGFLAFPWRNSRNYSVGRPLHLGLVRPDNHPALRMRRRKRILFIVVPLKWHPF